MFSPITAPLARKHAEKARKAAEQIGVYPRYRGTDPVRLIMDQDAYDAQMAEALDHYMDMEKG